MKSMMMNANFCWVMKPYISTMWSRILDFRAKCSPALEYNCNICYAFSKNRMALSTTNSQGNTKFIGVEKVRI